MTLLTIITNCTDELNLSAPSTAIGNTDANVARLVALANRSGKMIARRENLQQLTMEATHTSLATASQGVITTIAPGWQRFVEGSVWDRTNQWQMVGPLSPEEWQFMQSTNVSPSIPHFMIREDTWYIYATPAAGSTYAFEYFSKNWVTLAAGGTSDTFAADADTSKIDEDIIELDVIWRWLKLTGLDYGEEKREFEMALRNYVLNNHARPIMINGGPIAIRKGDYTAVSA